MGLRVTKVQIEIQETYRHYSLGYYRHSDRERRTHQMPENGGLVPSLCQFYGVNQVVKTRKFGPHMLRFAALAPVDYFLQLQSIIHTCMQAKRSIIDASYGLHNTR